MSSKEQIFSQKFEKIFKDYFTGLCYFASKYIGDMDTSKEIVHNVFLNIWENRNEFDWDKPAKSYLFTSVYNRSINYIRDHKKFASTDVNLELETKSEEFSNGMEVAELEGKIKQALQKLPEKCREIFELSRFEGKKYAEIADHLGLSVKTIETQMSKALKILKEELKEYIYYIIIFLLSGHDKF